jgi:hypothetical protein
MLGRWIGRGFLCAATAAAQLGAAPAATAADGLAKVAVVQNQVEAKKASADGWAPSARDQALFAHDRIRTGAASRAALLYSDQTLHRMGEKSELEILPPNGSSGSGLLNVVTGRHYFATRTPKDFGKVQTPTVTAAIKGTEFAVDVEADGTTTITMIEGTVEASNPYGTVTVVKGEQAVAAPGSAPQKRIVVHPRDAVAWALHYPAVVGGADAARLAGMGSAGEGLTRAATLLSQGQVDEARPLVAAGGRDPVALALASVIAVAGNAREDARRLADEAVAAGPDSASAALAAPSRPRRGSTWLLPPPRRSVRRASTPTTRRPRRGWPSCAWPTGTSTAPGKRPSAPCAGTPSRRGPTASSASSPSLSTRRTRRWTSSRAPWMQTPASPWPGWGEASPPSGRGTSRPGGR